MSCGKSRERASSVPFDDSFQEACLLSYPLLLLLSTDSQALGHAPSEMSDSIAPLWSRAPVFLQPSHLGLCLARLLSALGPQPSRSSLVSTFPCVSHEPLCPGASAESGKDNDASDLDLDMDFPGLGLGSDSRPSSTQPKPVQASAPMANARSNSLGARTAPTSGTAATNANAGQGYTPTGGSGTARIGVSSRRETAVGPRDRGTLGARSGLGTGDRRSPLLVVLLPFLPLLRNPFPCPPSFPVLFT